MNIVINAGHYPGLDSGAVGNTGLQECMVTKVVAEKVCEYLVISGHNAVTSQFNELYEITGHSNALPADIFVSIHCNAAENIDAKGTETFYVSQGGQRLAECVQGQIINTMQTVDRGVKPCNFYVVKNTDATAILVELAFISNEPDETLLAERGDDFAGAVYRGIIEYVASL